MTTTAPGRERIENGAQVLILLAVAGMAGAASFTHVHDWTMHNSPPGTGDWFGWANAMVSELIPLAAGLEARRRRRRGIPVGRYPIALIVGAVALSLAGQFAEAKPGVSGWLISAVPALGFLALIKLVLSTPTVQTQVSIEDSMIDQPPVLDGLPSPRTEDSVRPERATVPQPALLPIPAATFARANGGGSP